MATPHDTRATGAAPFLRQLGERVRKLRLRRGMTRKALALGSAVSARYLAQLEQGHGNISIGLLRQVADALETEPAELLRVDGGQSAEEVLIAELVRRLSPEDRRNALQLLYDRFSTPYACRRRIALVGLRGAGKTTLGTRLAQRRRILFVQLVGEIERLAGMAVSEIFSLSGEEGYRRLEERALAETIRIHPSCIVETGGSIVSEPRLLNTLLTTFFVVWVKATPKDHMQRVVEQGDLRPMANNEDAMTDLRRILREREPFYAKAHAILETSGRSIEECVAELESLLPPELLERDAGSARPVTMVG